MNIDTWLSEFENGWLEHDIEKVIALFDNPIEYWETPYKRLSSLEAVRSEWQAIKNQNEIELQTRVFASCHNFHTVTWNLKYLDMVNAKQEWAGIYLICLNADGKCYYFHQSGEKYQQS